MPGIIIEPLNLALMQEASRAIPGEHDFAAFRSARSMNHTTVREITRRLVAAGAASRLLVFEIDGKGFLALHGAEPGRHAWSRLAGASGRRGDIARLLAAPDRSPGRPDRPGRAACS